MNIRRLLTGLLILLGRDAMAQNLVPNPSFEEFRSAQRPSVGMGCHEDVKGVVCEEISDYLLDWYSPTSGTPDIFTSDPLLKGRDIHYGRLQRIFGPGYYRFAPHSGLYGTGLFTYYYWQPTQSIYREYIQTQLRQPLQTGKRYYAEMYVLFSPYRLSLTDSTLLQTGPYCSNIGLFFSADSVGRPKYDSHHNFLNDGLPLRKQPQLADTAYVSNWGCWHKIAGFFTADQPYRFLTIGNFFTDAYSNQTNPKLQQEGVAYYMIDDVKVVEAEQAPNLPESPCLGADRILCPGQTLTYTPTLTPLASLHYHWQDGSTKPSYTITQPGTYYVTVSDGLTTYTDSVTIRYQPSIKLPPDTTLCQSEVLTLAPSYPTKNFVWSTGSTDSTLSVSQTGQYWVSVANNHCLITDTINVQVVDCPSNVPNVFTPNGDSKNEAFVIDNVELRSWRLEIYNRWGSRVFESEPYRNQWRGEGLPEGVYYYDLYCESLRRRLKGWVQILR